MILLGLGTNLGDRKSNLEAALTALSEHCIIRRVSSVYESAALLPEDAPEEWDIPFYNIVCMVESDESAEQWLNIVKTIEQAMGREDIGRWGPRLIDIDILAHGDKVIQEERLVIPHPEMHQRDFVMLPVAEIAPHWVHPAMSQSPQSAIEIVRSFGMELGEGLMRLHMELNWKDT